MRRQAWRGCRRGAGVEAEVEGSEGGAEVRLEGGDVGSVWGEEGLVEERRLCGEGRGGQLIFAGRVR